MIRHNLSGLLCTRLAVDASTSHLLFFDIKFELKTKKSVSKLIKNQSYAIPRDRQSHLSLPQRTPNSANYRNFCNFGKNNELCGKNAIENGSFFFFTYERCRRRLSSIKMINGAEELLILLSTAFGYEYLF